MRSIRRLDGRPTLIVLDEAWVLLANGAFGAKIEEWLRTLRKKNAAMVLATQSLTEVANSPVRDVILESCPTKILLPNPEALNPATGELSAISVKERRTARAGTQGRSRHVRHAVASSEYRYDESRHRALWEWQWHSGYGQADKQNLTVCRMVES
jgi:hypothetical protein